MQLTAISSQGNTVPTDLVSVGHITGAYGINGWIRIQPYSTDADALLSVKTWWLSKPEMHDIDIMQVKNHGDGVVARVVGIADRDAAEALKGAVISISRSKFPALSDNEFYWVDLVGLSVENLQGEVIGTVVDLMDNGVHAILRVQPEVSDPAEKKPPEKLIPYVEQFVHHVSLEDKKIIVDWGVDY